MLSKHNSLKRYSTEVDKLLWRNVHGVVVMKKYWEGKQFPITKNCPNESRHNQDGSDSVPSKKGLAEILLS